MPIRRYAKVAVALHWIIALAIFFNLGMMLLVGDNDRSRAFFDLHKSIGITALGLVLLRILWRSTHRPPPLPNDYKPWEKNLAHWAHYALYGLILAMPLSGWMHDSAWKDAPTHPLTLFGVIPWFRLPPFTTMDAVPKEYWHKTLGFWHAIVFAYAIYGLLFLHIAGALKHQFADRKKELQRMWF